MFYFSEPHKFHITGADAIPYPKPKAQCVPESRTAQTLGRKQSTQSLCPGSTHLWTLTQEGDHRETRQSQHFCQISSPKTYKKTFHRLGSLQALKVELRKDSLRPEKFQGAQSPAHSGAHTREPPSLGAPSRWKPPLRSDSIRFFKKPRKCYLISQRQPFQ